MKIGTEEVYIISLTAAVVRIIILVDYILYNLHEFLEYLNEQPLKLTEFRVPGVFARPTKFKSCESYRLSQKYTVENFFHILSNPRFGLHIY